MNHTPIPWHYGGLDENGRVIIWGSDGGARNTVADCTCCGSLTREQDEANAEFIVRAVNSHSELLAACQTVAALADGQGRANLLHVAADARAAVAKATKPST